MIRFGTNRLVLVGKDFVYKIPIGVRGIRANKMEYSNSLGKDYVAQTERRWYGLRQERLKDLIILPLDFDEDLPSELDSLFRLKLNNRFQVGRGKDGNWKFFDFEDVKFYAKHNRGRRMI